MQITQRGLRVMLGEWADSAFALKPGQIVDLTSKASRDAMEDRLKEELKDFLARRGVLSSGAAFEFQDEPDMVTIHVDAAGYQVRFSVGGWQTAGIDIDGDGR